jgi:hypothetical protein
MGEFSQLVVDQLNAGRARVDVGPLALAAVGMEPQEFPANERRGDVIRAGRETVLHMGRTLLTRFNGVVDRTAPGFPAPSYEHLTAPTASGSLDVDHGYVLPLGVADKKGRSYLEFRPRYKFGPNAGVGFLVNAKGGGSSSHNARTLLPISALVTMHGRDFMYLDEQEGFRRRAADWLHRAYLEQQQMGALLSILFSQPR